MSEFKVQKGVKMPPRKCGCIPIYPWAQMKVGDSFEANKPQRTINASASLWGKRNGKKFSTRTLGKNKCRVWRVK